MKPDPRFINLPREFWADVRLISQEVGYKVRGKQQVKVASVEEIQRALGAIGLRSDHLFNTTGAPTELGRILLEYFAHRSKALHHYAESLLMTADQAKALYEQLRDRLTSKCPIPLNKQSGKKKAPAYFTAIINMLIEAGAKNNQCDYDPRVLTTVTRDGRPVRTLARRVDGAFPSAINPVAIWEIKEYYYTTTFGSRVADGVYETLLDGMEVEELRIAADIDIKHYLMIDARYTWWECGLSYLCRIVDMVHMGYVDEVLFGREVEKRLPQLVREWVRTVRKRAPC